MAKARLVNTHFWDDGFIRRLPAGDKLLYLYLITNPCTNIAGAYEITLDRMRFDTGMDEKRLNDAIKRLSEADKLTYKDDWICVHNFIKNQSKSEKVEKGIVEAVKHCPDWIKDTLCKRYAYLSIYLNTKSNTKPKRKASHDARVVEVFEEVKRVLNHSWILDAKRHRHLAAWLDHYSVEDLKLVPHGVLKSEWHNGKNPEKRIYHQISTIFKDAERIDSFIELAKKVVVSTTNGRGPTARELIAQEQATIRQEMSTVQ